MNVASMLVMMAVLLISTVATGQEVVDGFAGRVLAGARGTKMPYRLYVPEERVRTRPLPLIVYLHGGGGAGDDNLRQISGGNTAGTRLFTSAAVQAKHPAFVVAPQMPARNTWSDFNSDTPAPYATLVLELVATLSREFMIDADRIYLTGQSLGGGGTWDLVSKRPNVFAAAVPLCGNGNAQRVQAARHISIWAFHGAQDEVVPVEGSRELVAALKSVGSSVKYTEYPDAGHDVWTRAYADPQLPDWLFAQKRSRR
jgi:predicted peptidase